MVANTPCRGCWWIEGGKCFNDKLGAVPRGRPLFSGENGMEIDDALLEKCIADGPQVRKSAVIGRFAAQLRAAGVQVEVMTTDQAAQQINRSNGKP